MKRSILRASLLLLAFWVTGGQWLMLQSVAWVNMARAYSQETTLSKALAETFDGNHPCRLCRFIQKEKAAENTPTKMTVPSFKTPLFFVVFAVLAVLFSLFGRLHFAFAVWPSSVRIPLVPPPKPLLS